MDNYENRKEYYNRPEVKEHRKEYRKRPEVKERQKEYENRPEVKEHRKDYGKEYRKINKDVLLQKNREKTECEICGSVVTKRQLIRHKKTDYCKKHLQK